MADELVWQPVRIAPVTYHSEQDDALENWKASVGKIIRVRPTDKYCYCGRRSYQINGIDFEKLNLPIEDVELYICECQIQAD